MILDDSTSSNDHRGSPSRSNEDLDGMFSLRPAFPKPPSPRNRQHQTKQKRSSPEPHRQPDECNRCSNNIALLKECKDELAEVSDASSHQIHLLQEQIVKINIKEQDTRKDSLKELTRLRNSLVHAEKDLNVAKIGNTERDKEIKKVKGDLEIERKNCMEFQYELGQLSRKLGEAEELLASTIKRNDQLQVEKSELFQSSNSLNEAKTHLLIAQTEIINLRSNNNVLQEYVEELKDLLEKQQSMQFDEQDDFEVMVRSYDESFDVSTQTGGINEQVLTTESSMNPAFTVIRDRNAHFIEFSYKVREWIKALTADLSMIQQDREKISKITESMSLLSSEILMLPEAEDDDEDFEKWVDITPLIPLPPPAPASSSATSIYPQAHSVPLSDSFSLSSFPIATQTYTAPAFNEKTIKKSRAWAVKGMVYTMIGGFWFTVLKDLTYIGIEFIWGEEFDSEWVTPT